MLANFFSSRILFPASGRAGIFIYYIYLFFVAPFPSVSFSDFLLGEIFFVIARAPSQCRKCNGVYLTGHATFLFQNFLT